MRVLNANSNFDSEELAEFVRGRKDAGGIYCLVEGQSESGTLLRVFGRTWGKWAKVKEKEGGRRRGTTGWAKGWTREQDGVGRYRGLWPLWSQHEWRDPHGKVDRR